MPECAPGPKSATAAIPAETQRDRPDPAFHDLAASPGPRTERRWPPSLRCLAGARPRPRVFLEQALGPDTISALAAAPPSPALAADAPAFSASVRASPDPLRPTSPGVAALSRVGLAPVSYLVFEQRMNANPRCVDRDSASLAATLRLGRILPARKPAQPITEPACFSSAARTGPKPMFPLQCEDSFDYDGSSTSWTRSSS